MKTRFEMTMPIKQEISFMQTYPKLRKKASFKEY